jgi:hypothetical protein
VPCVLCYMSSSRVVGSGTNTVRFGEKSSEETVKTGVLQITVLLGVCWLSGFDRPWGGGLSGLVARGGRTGLCSPNMGFMGRNGKGVEG